MIEDIKAAIEALQKGGVILYPTDTIWGLGCDATNVEAVKRLYNIKKRDESRHMIILMDNAALLDRYVDEVPEIAYDLIELTDKPLTIIYDGAKNLAKNLIGPDGSIGIRITEESFSAALVRRFRKPLVSTSANLSGKPSPANFGEISHEIIAAVDYVVKYRQDELTKGNPSGIMKLGRGGEVKIVRE